ncbi:MAG: hypothetical protein J1F69_05365 [Clostridiales bacterium]|nr:hypothetical protein [Clostridiales bacterium]
MEKPEQEQSTIEPQSAKERFTATLKEYANRINSVRNDVYTTKWWQFVVNFLLGAGAFALLLASMLTDGGVMAVCAILGVALVIALFVFNYVVRSITPSSFLQYTYLERDKGRRLKYMILSKKRASFFDGEHTIESNRDMAAMMEQPLFEQYRFDFFADMDPTERITDGEKEAFKGVLEHDGKQYNCRIVFVSGIPIYGTVGGARIKYFDINNTKEKFVVPVTLKRAAKALKVDFPKIPGLYIKDDIKDYTKQ